jgi:transposase InsO family protein
MAEGYIARETRAFAGDVGMIPCRNPTPDAAILLRQLRAWFADYNLVHPRSAMQYRSPHEFSHDQQVLQSCPAS